MIPALARLLQEGRFVTRYDAADVLGVYRYDEALRVLQEQYARERNKTVREILAHSIAALEQAKQDNSLVNVAPATP